MVAPRPPPPGALGGAASVGSRVNVTRRRSLPAPRTLLRRGPAGLRRAKSVPLLRIFLLLFFNDFHRSAQPVAHLLLVTHRDAVRATITRLLLPLQSRARSLHPARGPGWPRCPRAGCGPALIDPPASGTFHSLSHSSKSTLPPAKPPRAAASSAPTRPPGWQSWARSCSLRGRRVPGGLRVPPGRNGDPPVVPQKQPPACHPCCPPRRGGLGTGAGSVAHWVPAGAAMGREPGSALPFVLAWHSLACPCPCPSHILFPFSASIPIHNLIPSHSPSPSPFPSPSLPFPTRLPSRSFPHLHPHPIPFSSHLHALPHLHPLPFHFSFLTPPTSLPPSPSLPLHPLPPPATHQARHRVGGSSSASFLGAGVGAHARGLPAGFWKATCPSTCSSPLLAFVNSKSGDNQGVKFLRKFKQFLNPAQVFDLMNGGPHLG